jgi:hypothetical protein
MVRSGADWTGAAATRGCTAAAGGEGQEYQGGFRTTATGEDKESRSLYSQLYDYFLKLFNSCYLLVLW